MRHRGSAIVAGQAAISDHIHIGKDAIIEGQAGAMRDVADGDVQVGSPAFPIKQYWTEIAHIHRLPKMYDEFKTMKKRMEQLEVLLKERELVKG